MAANHHTPQAAVTPGAAILAWIWPGAGHISLGQTKRGLLLMTGVLFLYISGLFIGGINVVDRKEDRLWFLAQAFCGPIAFGTDYLNQQVLKTQSEEEQNQTTSIGRVNEIGTLYCALAGLMNFVVILDALHFTPRHPKPHKRRHSDHKEPTS